MALTDFAVALCVLMGTLIIPFSVLYVLLRLKRGATTKSAAVKVVK